MTSTYDYQPGRHRNPDHDSSIDGARMAGNTSKNFRDQLLLEFSYVPETGWTDYEAGRAAGLLDTCYWKRVGELRLLGFVEFTGERRKAPSGVARKVSRITEAGLEYLGKP